MSIKLLVPLAILLLAFGCASPPAGGEVPRDLELRINEGKELTVSSEVELSLFARNAAECRLSNDGQSWSAWEAYTREKGWALDGVDGQKQVYYQCRNSAGELSPVISSSVELDATPPSISVLSPVDGQTYYNSVDLSFNISDPASDTVTCAANIGSMVQDLGILHTNKQQNVVISLSAGEKEISLKCSDGLHTSESRIRFTMKKRPLASFTINGGSEYTDNRNVTLTVNPDSLSECRFSNDNLQWTAYQPYQEILQWTLKGTDGKKRVYAQCRDQGGVETEILEDYIVLDSKPPPYISISIDNGALWTSSENVTLGLYAFAAKDCRFSNDGQSWSEWEAYSTRKAWKLSGGQGQKTVYYECRNKSGSDIGQVSAQIVYSETPSLPPTALSISINKGDAYASVDDLQLSLSAAGAFECRFREGNLEWTDWENYSASRTFTLSGNDGAKTIYYQCRNDYGSTTVFDRIYLDRVPPSSVGGLEASSSPYSVVLTWDPATDSGSGVDSYSIFRKVDSAWRWVGLVSGISFKDEKVVSGETYEYRVQALDHNLNAGPLSTVSVQVPLED